MHIVTPKTTPDAKNTLSGMGSGCGGIILFFIIKILHLYFL
jgi:hypothetical protein